MRINNKLKQLGALALAAALTLSMGVTAAAAPDDPADNTQNRGMGSLTINAQGRDGAVFTIYPVMSFQIVTDGGGKLIYTNVKVQDAFKDAVAKAELTDKDGSRMTGLDAISRMDGLSDQNLPSSQVAQFAAQLAAVDSKPGGTDYTIRENASEEQLPYGYYLIEETTEAKGHVGVKSSPILVAVPGDTSGNAVAVNVKSSKPDVSKEIVQGDSAAYNTAAVGDTVKFKVTSDIPIYGPDISDAEITYIITDKLSSGLTYNKDLKISIDGTVYYNAAEGGNRLDPVITEPEAANQNALVIDLSGKLGKDIRLKAEAAGGAKFDIEYSAALNENAVMGNTGNPNEVSLTYEKEHTTETKTTQTYTSSLKVIKLEQSAAGVTTETKLSGAAFKLQKEENGVYTDLLTEAGEIWTEITDSEGALTFTGLDAGKYKLIETAAPAGYGLDLTERMFELSLASGVGAGKVIWTGIGSQDTEKNDIIRLNEISQAPGTFETSIYNVKGISLPGTGGSGTTMFKVTGGVLILTACAMLFGYYRKKGKERGK